MSFPSPRRLWKACLEFLETHEAKKVVAVRLAIGELTCVEAEQLRSCYNFVTEGTAISESELEIERTEAAVSVLIVTTKGHQNTGTARYPAPASRPCNALNVERRAEAVER